MSFGDKLQQVRKAGGMTQEAFAEQLKVSRQAVSKWESAKGYPEIEKILYICNRYQVTMDELFADELTVAPKEKTAQPKKETAAPAPELKTPTFKTALASFLNNLSPVDKRILLGLTILLALGLLWLMSGQNPEGGDRMMILVWIGAMVVFGIVEALTAGLTSIWFVIGSAAALIVAICGGAIWLQGVVFLLVSAVALIATRPLVEKLMKKDKTATNADRAIGQEARVTEEIDNAVPTGAVYTDGKTWTARSENGQVLEVGTTVRVVHIEGVKLFVEPVEVSQEVNETVKEEQ
ncbi:MAG: helix-turn-helix domain-containing protein [Clostridiales bacterium]|nr:helix-turn-helix domain-containing protein [Clostridiales bacterium]